MTALVTPIALWLESPLSGVAVSLDRLYWHFDSSGVGTWTLVSDPRLESGRLADPDLDGTYELTLLAFLTPGTPVLRMTRRADGVTLAY